jgi:diguanylate cyclase (GGDEF)-like protein
MSLDIRTTVMIAAVLALLVGASMRYALRDYPALLLSVMRSWMLGVLLLPIGWMLYSMRNAAPDIFSVVIANGLLSLAFACMVAALRQFVGVAPKRPVVYLPVVAVLVWEVAFDLIWPNARLRVAGVSALIAVQMLTGAHVLLGGGRTPPRSHGLTAAAFLVLAAALGARTLYEGLRVGTLISPFEPSLMQTTAFAVAAVFPVVATLGFLLMCNDRLYRQLEQQATIDALTGISNRRALGERAAPKIAAAQQRGESLALLMIDADHFKRINDAHGHECGDEALRTLARVLQKSLGENRLVGRLGGEEFVAVLRNTDEPAAMAHAEALRAAVEQTQFEVEGSPVALRVSVGVAMIEPDDDFARLLRRADQALYAAKQAGRNRVFGPAELKAALASAPSAED